MAIKDCLAAKHNPANACEDKCKWPNACGLQNSTAEPAEPAAEPDVVEEAVKPKRSRKTTK